LASGIDPVTWHPCSTGPISRTASDHNRLSRLSRSRRTANDSPWVDSKGRIDRNSLMRDPSASIAVAHRTQILGERGMPGEIGHGGIVNLANGRGDGFDFAEHHAPMRRENFLVVTWATLSTTIRNRQPRRLHHRLMSGNN